VPDRINEIVKKAPLSKDNSDLLDQLGIDFLFNYQGNLYGVDITTSRKSSVAYNKVTKFQKLAPLLTALDITPVLIQWHTPEISSESLGNILQHLSPNPQVIQIKATALECSSVVREETTATKKRNNYWQDYLVDRKANNVLTP
jgi:hypothetical protein